MPRSTRKQTAMAAEVQQISGNLEKMQTSLFDELHKLKESVGVNTRAPSHDGTDQTIVDKGEISRNAEIGNMSLFETFEVKARKIFENMHMEIRRLTDELRRDIAAINRDINMNCLVFYGISEDIVYNQIIDKIVSIINEKLPHNITQNDIDYTIRLGKKPDTATDKKRPLLIRFINRWKRDTVYAEKKHLKGSGILIGEMLTKQSLDLFKLVRERLGNKVCWTWRGDVFVYYDGERRKIGNIDTLEVIVKN